jgi:hypothetical protein
MKTCRKCGIAKPIEEFYNNKAYKDGHLSRCKSCCSEFEQSTAGIERRLRYSHSSKGKEHAKQYRQSDKRISANRQYAKKYRETENGKVVTKKYYEKSKTEHPEMYKARTALMHAMQDGKIKKPSVCDNCGKQHYYIHGHHWSYLPEHRLDIIWLCPSCHKLIHQNTATSST